MRPKGNAAADVQTRNAVYRVHSRPTLKISLASRLSCVTHKTPGRCRRLTCEDVLRRDLGLHFQRVLGGVRDLGAHVSHLADKDGRQELGLLHADQSCNTAVLKEQKMVPGG